MEQIDEQKLKSARSLDQQILAVLATMVGSVIVIITLQGTRDRLLNVFPGKNYDYLERLPRISGLIFMLTAIFYFYDTWRQRRETPQQKGLTLLMAANFLALVAAVVKLELIYERHPDETAQQEADQSSELEN